MSRVDLAHTVVGGTYAGFRDMSRSNGYLTSTFKCASRMYVRANFLSMSASSFTLASQKYLGGSREDKKE